MGASLGARYRSRRHSSRSHRLSSQCSESARRLRKRYLPSPALAECSPEMPLAVAGAGTPSSPRLSKSAAGPAHNQAGSLETPAPTWAAGRYLSRVSSAPFGSWSRRLNLLGPCWVEEPLRDSRYLAVEGF